MYVKQALQSTRLASSGRCWRHIDGCREEVSPGTKRISANGTIFPDYGDSDASTLVVGVKPAHRGGV